LQTCVVLGDKTVQCWGGNHDGELGNVAVTSSTFDPVTVSGITNAVAVAAGFGHTCALLEDGSIRCWGSNGAGQLGDSTTVSSPEPVSVLEIDNAVSVSVARQVSCALLDDGTVRCWGTNSFGQLGTFTTSDDYSAVPVTIAGVSDAVALATGDGHSCAVLSDGTVLCWGSNRFGELGDGTTTDSPSPVFVSSVVDATAVAASGSHSCALLRTGEIQCWGHNACGGLGNGTSTTTGCLCIPTAVSVTGITNAVAISGDCAVLEGGGLQCWGSNTNGELGNGSSEMCSDVPVTVTGF
jgi:alpha-tubulin suppressor-like RCC1 family protein